MTAIADPTYDSADKADDKTGRRTPEPTQTVPGASLDPIFRGVLYASGLLVLVLLGSIIVLLFQGGLPALMNFGVSFFWNTVWNPPREIFSAGITIYGTLLTGLVALVIALPMSFGITFFLTEIATPRLRRPIGTAIQLLAAVPSIIFGMWGFFVIVPILAAWVYPPLVSFFSYIPVLSTLFKGPATGMGILTAAIILALMIIPFITAVFVEIVESVPAMLKESAYGVGATTFEVFRNVSVPYGRRALVGATMLGLGRALCETMAVTYVIGNANRISTSLFAPGATIASTIANEFPEAEAGSIKMHSLLELGFALFVISFIVLAISRALVGKKKH